MQKRLSGNIDKKVEIRERWNNYIRYKINQRGLSGLDDIDFSILTLTCEGIGDIKKYLEIEELDIGNIFAVSDQPISQEIKNYININFGLPESDFKNYFQQGMVEDVIGKKITKHFDIINLDYSNTFYTNSKIPTLSRSMNPQGIETIIKYFCLFNKEFTILLTNKIDLNPTSELNEFSLLNNYIREQFKESFLFLPNDNNLTQLKSLAAILCDVSFITLSHKNILKNAFVTIYSPENTYWMYMAILEFEPLYDTVFEYYIDSEYKNKENICKCIDIVRNSLLKIRRI